MFYNRNANYFLALVSFSKSLPSAVLVALNEVFVPPAIIYYDYILTLGDEIRFFWGRKTSSVALLYFANRYISMIGHIPVILQTSRNWSMTVSNGSLIIKSRTFDSNDDFT